LSIWLIAVAAAAGDFLGDSGSYGLGRTVGAAAARRLFRSPKAKGRLTWAGKALERHGATIIVVARFVPGGRTATTFTAGTVRLAWPRFAAADAVGATLWAAYAAGLGYLGGETFERRPLYAFLFGLGVALLVALVVEAARRLRRRVPGLADRGALGGRSERLGAILGWSQRDPGTGQQPDALVEDAQVEAEGAEPGVGEPSQPDKGVNKQRSHPAKQDAAIGHGQAPPSAGTRRRLRVT
jgi:membrane protein DedA with SNARE-associated domain